MADTARERLAEALKGRVRGQRSPGGTAPMVEVSAADLREVANEAGNDPMAAHLLRAARPFANESPGRKVVVQADDLFAILEGHHAEE